MKTINIFCYACYLIEQKKSNVKILYGKSIFHVPHLTKIFISKNKISMKIPRNTLNYK